MSECVFCNGDGGPPGHETSECRLNSHNDNGIEEREASDRAWLLRQLTDRRKAVGMTQGEVAAAMGTTQSAISNLERGIGDPLVKTLLRYGRAVGLNIKLSVTKGAPKP